MSRGLRPALAAPGNGSHDLRPYSLRALLPPRYDHLVPATAPALPPGAVLAIDCRGTDCDGLLRVAPTFDELRSAWRGTPLALVVAADARQILAAANARLLAKGVRAILADGLDWPSALRQALTAEECVPDVVLDYLLHGRRYRAGERELLHRIVTLGQACRLEGTLYRQVAPGTVAERLRRLRLPSAASLKALGCAARLAAQLQREPSRRCEELAYSLGYADSAAITLSLKRAFGLGVRDVRCTIGWDWLLERWETRRRAPQRCEQGPRALLS